MSYKVLDQILIFRKSYLSLSVFVVLALTLRLVLENESLPDYESYSGIFSDPDNFSAWNIVFTIVASSFGYFFSYEAFRVALFMLGVALYCHKQRHFNIPQILAIFFFTALVLLEFHMIRLRAGICIITFFYGFHFFLKKSKISTILLFLISFLLHPATFITLLIAYYPRFLAIRFRNISYGLMILLWIVFLIGIDIRAEGRGEHLYSGINSVRILGLILFPILVYIAINSFKFGRLNHHHHTEFIAHHTLTIALLILYIGGFFAYSGEAIIRVYSIIAGPVMLVGLSENLGIWRVDQLITAIMILAANSLFFINTVYF